MRKLIVSCFYVNRENILKTAKALVEDTKTLVAGAASNQEQLAVAAQCAVKTITRLADVVKLGAASLGSEQSEAQVSRFWSFTFMLSTIASQCFVSSLPFLSLCFMINVKCNNHFIVILMA